MTIKYSILLFISSIILIVSFKNPAYIKEGNSNMDIIDSSLCITEFTQISDPNQPDSSRTPIISNIIATGTVENEKHSLNGKFDLGKKWLCIRFEDSVQKTNFHIEEIKTKSIEMDWLDDTITFLKEDNESDLTDIAFRDYSVKDFHYIPQKDLVDTNLMLSINKRINKAVLNGEIRNYRQFKSLMKMQSLKSVHINKKEIIIAFYEDLDRFDKRFFVIDKGKVYDLGFDIGGYDRSRIHFFKLKKRILIYGENLRHTASHTTVHQVNYTRNNSYKCIFDYGKVYD